MAFFMVFDLRINDFAHENFFLDAVILKVVFQPVKGDLDLLFSNFSISVHILNCAMQFIDKANQVLVVFVKVLDADAEIIRPHQNHEVDLPVESLSTKIESVRREGVEKLSSGLSALDGEKMRGKPELATNLN
jgi:dihydrodipicolinate reductase